MLLSDTFIYFPEGPEVSKVMTSAKHMTFWFHFIQYEEKQQQKEGVEEAK